ncbi:hypothetical protein XBI1_650023 [Xenorhabdus bovienii str. Intermedium]|uniref:Uncharacterized protein n=1 Tax=Xenorhabdus bovienii str. Intermedium TaxID=1379677 RepID=A0A077QQT0_XENBV|nr:hypothetical protein XBI1_650023 [Xenorhabdus bovienii str. Intermedium]
MVGCRKADLIILPGTGHIHTATTTYTNKIKKVLIVLKQNISLKFLIDY